MVQKVNQSTAGSTGTTGLEIAVIGMSGRFPNAKDIDRFWENLKNGIESILFFSDQELAEVGIDSQLLDHPHYVRASVMLEDIEYFDANFFGYTTREADVMDPQMRVFHESAWNALEDAGYCPDTYEGLVGIYAGASTHPDWEFHVHSTGKADEIGRFAAQQFADKDFLCTLVSYRLNLKGPAVGMQTACSTSLVSIHMACQALLGGECDMALAGGVNITILGKAGYIYQEGMISSPDGHCRAFSSQAKGTIQADGVGVVVLKRLEKALRDGDHIYALVKGSAINNDGVRKIGFTAPSIEGQAEVIIAAQEVAEVEPESITYVETHGTATDLGDPVEIDALKLAFDTDKKGYCAIGSVKTNMGHLNAAAGVTGFIKAVLAVYHRQIPPSLHFESPNAKIDFANSPFYVNTGLKEWKTSGYPLRACVNSFGIGGTNAHVILEEPPPVSGSVGQWVSDSVRNAPEGTGGLAPLSNQLILLSAKTPTALDKMTINLVNFLKENRGSTLTDTAYTLQVGRKAFKHRRMLVCSTVEEAVEILSEPGSDRLYTHMKKDEQQDPQIIFMFPGQGAQYVNMGLELYQTQPLFQEEMNRCFEILKPIMGYDIKEILYPNYRSNRSYPSYNTHKSHIDQTEIAQPLIFILEYALAKLLIDWGIKPYAMIGHSIGEYVAACLSGVFSLEPALELVALRGRLMQQMPGGSMIGVPLTEKELIPLLDSHNELSLAAVNSKSHCVVSGPHEPVEALARHLKEKGHETRTLHTSHAFHSKMMEPMLKEFEESASRLVLKEKAEIPYISNVTGTWARIKEAASPRYWAAHIRNTVRFYDGITELFKNKSPLFIEVGPGRTLGTFVRNHENKKPGQKIIDLIRHPKEEVSDTYYLLKQVGHLWIYGGSIDWLGFYHEEKPRRISLPGYPFKGERYQLAANTQLQEPHPTPTRRPGKIPDIAQWFYIPTWKLSPVHNDLENRQPGVEGEQDGKFMVLVNQEPLVVRLVELLEQNTEGMIIVETGAVFSRLQDDRGFAINPRQESDYHQLFRELESTNRMPRKIIHGWNVTDHSPRAGAGSRGLEPGKLDEAQDLGFYSLLYLARAIGKHGKGVDDGDNAGERIEMIVLTNGMQVVTGAERAEPLKALLRGALQVIPREFPGIACRSIDIDYPLPDSTSPHEPRLKSLEPLLKNLETEIKMNADSPALYVAYRNGLRFTPTYEQIPWKMKEPGVPVLKEKGVYLVTGGLGGIGLELAEYLAKVVKARLVLVGRSLFPPREQWDQWLETHDPANRVCGIIHKIRDMEASGAEVLIFSADTANLRQMQKVAARVEGQWGYVNGIIHSAGLPDGGLIPARTREMSETVLAPKVKGTLVLETLFCNERNQDKLDFLVLCSSLSSVLSAVGQVAYSAANAFLDSYACARTANPHTYTVSINWDSWQKVGMAVKAEEQLKASSDNLSPRNPGFLIDTLKDALLPAEGVEVFQQVLTKGIWPQVLISTTDLLKRIKESRALSAKILLDRLPRDISSIPQHPRPGLSTPYAAPGTGTQQSLVHLWQQFLGIAPVGIHDDFFELGGDSLKVMTISAKIHKELNIEIPLTEFFNRPTIKKLAQYIDKETKQAYSAIVPAELKEYYPLSSAQQRLYILHQVEKDFIGYNETFLIVMEGELDKEKFHQAIHRLIKIHESLRTSFETVNDEPVQRIYNEVKFAIDYDEPGHRGKRMPAANCWQPESIIKDFVRPFDLSRAPLMRLGLIEAGKEKHILIYDIHHIITDGTSMNLFLRDLLVLYGGDEFPSLHIQYKDFSEWQNRLLKDHTIKRQEGYWLNRFPGEIPVLELPTDYPRPSMQSFAGKSIGFQPGKEDTHALKKLALKENITLYMVFAAIYTIFLSKISGQEDIVIGVPVAGRTHADLEPIMGMFVNTLPLRNYPAGEKTFLEFLTEIKKQTLEALENQQYQVEDLVEKLAVNINRDTSRNPLFDVTFVFQNIAIKWSDLQVPGKTRLKLTHCDFETRPAKFDLALYVNEADETLFLQVVYCAKLFKKETVTRWIRYLKKIISSIINEPGTKISRMEIISAQEKKQLLFDFNDTAASYPGNKTIHELFSEQVERTPGHIALIGAHESRFEGTGGLAPLSTPISITYRQLNEKSHQLAYLLMKRGVKPDAIVGIMIERSVEMIIGILGILKAGGAYLPIDPDYPPERINYMLADSKTKFLVTTTGLSEKFKKLLIVNCQLLIVNEKPPGCPGFNNPPKEANSINNYQLTIDNLQLECSNLAYIIYTSGTTGKPKGVLIRHGNVVRLMVNDKFQFNFNENDVWTLFHSLCFDFSVWETYGALLYGGRLVIVPKMLARDTEGFIKLLKKNQVTILNQTPSAFYNLVNLELKQPKRGLHLKYIIFGGEALAPTRLEEWKATYPQTRLINMYGITETTVHVTFKEITNKEIQSNTSNIGQPIPTLSVYLMDKYLNPVPIGVAGELVVAGAGVVRGYLNRPELTSERFCLRQPGRTLFEGTRGLAPLSKKAKKVPDKRITPHSPHSFHSPQYPIPPLPHSPIYRSSDLARRLPNGDLEYLGRTDQQVKIRGFRIELEEIETQLTRHPGIDQAVALSKQDQTSEKYLCAYFVSQRTIPVSELRDYLLKVLPDYMIPAYFVQVDKIPLTPNGKIDRKALPAPGITIGKDYTAPRDEREKKLVEIWSEVLGHTGTPSESMKYPGIDIDDNFFELGGHSLRAAVAASKIHKAFNIKIPLGVIFKTPTIRGLAAYIKEARPDKYTSIAPAEKKQYYRLSSSQERLYMLQQMKTEAVIYNMPGVFLLEGKINREKLEQIFYKLIHRHETFRTGFIVSAGEVYQETRESVDFAIQYYGTDGKAQGTGGEFTAVIDDFIRPFDLGKPPLLRVGLIKISPQEHIFMMDMHHIISDGTSQSLLVKELMALYAEETLPLLRIQYKDYSEWQHNSGTRKMLKIQEEYWQEEFPGEVPVLNLPTDFPRPEAMRFEGSMLDFEIDGEETKALKKIAIEEEVSLFGLLLAILNVLISKITGQADISIGTQVAGRRHTDLHQIIGVFLNTLVLRNDLDKNKSFKDLLHQVMERTLQAFENQDYPFENLVKKILGKREISRNPLFDVMLVWQNFESNGIKIPTLNLKPYHYEHKSRALIDLSLYGLEREGKLSFTFEYSTELFKKESIERFSNYFKEIIAAVTADKDIKLKDIKISHHLGMAAPGVSQEEDDQFGF